MMWPTKIGTHRGVFERGIFELARAATRYLLGAAAAQANVRGFAALNRYAAKEDSTWV